MKKHPGYSLPNSVTPRNLFPISTRHTQPNLALCQVFHKALTSGVFHFFKDHTYNFYVQRIPLLFYSLNVEFISNPPILASILQATSDPLLEPAVLYHASSGRISFIFGQ